MDNLNVKSHNYLRIDRILAYLGILQLQKLKRKWMIKVIEEFKNGNLSNTQIIKSMKGHWFKNFPQDIEVELNGLLES